MKNHFWDDFIEGRHLLHWEAVALYRSQNQVHLLVLVVNGSAGDGLSA